MNKEYVKLINVTKIIKGKLILDHINLNISKGKIYGIRGINGSGKTMLLRAIAGLMHVKGEVLVDGEKIDGGCFPKSIGVLIETPAFLPEFTAKENMELLSIIQSGINKSVINETLDMVGLDADDKRKYNKFSLGMKQRLGIAQAIVGCPDLILLDEPTNALDKSGITQLITIIKQLREKGCTLMIASHDEIFLEEVSDHIYYMEQGKIK